MVATGWSRYNGMTTYCGLWWAAPLTLHLACTAMRNGKLTDADWASACGAALGIDDLSIDWASSWTRLPGPTGDAPSAKRLKYLRAIVEVAQWRRAAESVLANRWLASGRTEGPGRQSPWVIRRERDAAEQIEADWPQVQSRFAETLAGVLHPEDINAYLASRRRIGSAYLRPILEE